MVRKIAVGLVVVATVFLVSNNAEAQFRRSRSQSYQHYSAPTHTHHHSYSQPSTTYSQGVTYHQPTTVQYQNVQYQQAMPTTYHTHAVSNGVTPTSHTTYYRGDVAANPTASVSGTAASVMLDRNNQVRASRGMPAMKLSERLTQAAQHHAAYMANTGSFSHNVNGNPQSRAAMFGYNGAVRENIAMGQNSVSQAFQDWVNSSGHYTNLMSGHNAAGFGYAVGRNGQGYWVAMYGDE